MAETERDLHKCADTLVFHAQTAFGGLATSDQKRQALLDYHIGLVRLIEDVGTVALRITGEIDMQVSDRTVNILPREPFNLTETMEKSDFGKGPALLIERSKLPYFGRLQIGSTARLTRATGVYTGHLVPVLGIREDEHEWLITVHRGGKRFEYPDCKTEPLVETYKGFDIVLRQSRHELFHFIYGADGYAVCAHGSQGRIHSLAEARAEVDRLIAKGDLSALDHWRQQKAEKDKRRYTVERQVDGTWAIFHGGGFVQGGFRTREAAAYEANLMITADQEAGVPVEMGVG